MSHLTKFAAALLLVVSLAACDKNNNPSETDSISNDVVLKWNRVAFETIGGRTNLHSLLASRMYAMVHGAMFDAVNATNPVFTPYIFTGTDKSADPQVAAAAAAHQVLKVMFPQRAPFVDSVLNDYLAGLPASNAKTNGLALGKAAGDAILQAGFNSNGASDPIGQPAAAVKAGDYKVLPPYNFIFAAFWDDSKLFSLEAKDQFRCVPPPALTSDAYKTALNEVKEIGKLQSTTRTADQTAFAKYWYEDSQEGWNRIASIVATTKKSGLITTARMFALLNFALADAYTAGWDSKLHYNLWRPMTAIREAAVDGNPLTDEDLTWEPSEPTPPIQDYPSTHSALGNAAATVLAYVYGNQTPFTMGSPTALPEGATRTFNSFSQAANENASSRVMAGIHFRFSCDAGQELGTRIGEWTVMNHLKAVK